MSDHSDRHEETESEKSVAKPQHNRFVQCLINNRFMLTIIAAMPGDIYIRLLKLTILPLIASNVIIVIAKLDPKENGKISTVAFIYIVAFNILGASIGTAASVAIGPGKKN
ncbi:Excitatory amino acid transporter 2 [Taenia solium]|eukprot:TsM_001103100 transcript=TsM_001103100 gene=TsM_001103100